MASSSKNSKDGSAAKAGPEKPPELRLVFATSVSIVVEWQGFSNIPEEVSKSLQYVVSYRRSGDDEWSEAPETKHEKARTKYGTTITGLQNATLYDMKVTARFTPIQQLQVKTKYKDINVVLLGRVGAGKSALGNFLIGVEKFKSHEGPMGVTKDICWEEIEQHSIRIIDVPGFFSPVEGPEEMMISMNRNLKHLINGSVTIFLIVIAVGRWSKENTVTIKLIEQMFGEQIYKRSILVFTKVDQLIENESTLEEFIKTLPGTSQTLLDNCGKRYFGINAKNSSHASENTKQLIDMISDLAESQEVFSWSIPECTDVQKSWNSYLESCHWAQMKK